MEPSLGFRSSFGPHWRLFRSLLLHHCHHLMIVKRWRVLLHFFPFSGCILKTGTFGNWSTVMMTGLSSSVGPLILLIFCPQYQQLAKRQISCLPLSLLQTCFSTKYSKEGSMSFAFGPVTCINKVACMVVFLVAWFLVPIMDKRVQFRLCLRVSTGWVGGAWVLSHWY